MNRIAYFANLDIRFENGVAKKVARQIQAWLGYGKEVRLFALSRGENIWNGFDHIPVSVVSSSRMRMGLTKSAAVFRAIDEWQPDLIYYRYGLYLPRSRQLFTRFPTVLELNNDDLAEYKMKYPTWAYLYHKMTRNGMLSNADGMVLVSQEISACFASYGKPMLVSSNGIDLAQYPMAPPAQNPCPVLVFMVGNPQSAWHGLDQIMLLAEHFPKWHFDIIGAREDQVGPTPPPRNVTCHGRLSRDEYEPIICRADVAIGTMALYRKAMAEASPLKVREYLAYGIPTIIAYDDTDFPTPPSFLLQLPNSENGVAANLAAIEDFVMQWKGKRLQRDAVQHLDIDQKEGEKLRFFEHIVAGA